MLPLTVMTQERNPLPLPPPLAGEGVARARDGWGRLRAKQSRDGENGPA